jgi:hypothetical protein
VLPLVLFFAWQYLYREELSPYAQAKTYIFSSHFYSSIESDGVGNIDENNGSNGSNGHNGSMGESRDLNKWVNDDVFEKVRNNKHRGSMNGSREAIVVAEGQ